MKRNAAPEGLALIETLAAAYARARAELASTVAAWNEEREAVTKRYLKGMRAEVAVAKDRAAELRAAIEAAPELFEKPRTRTLHGVKLGYQKGKGRVTFEDAAKVVALIRKHLPELADALVIIEEKPNKDAIAQLPAADVKRIACALEGTGDVVVIKDSAGEVDRLVNQLLKEEAEEAAS